MNNNEIKLCCGKKGCPTIKKSSDRLIKIKDDHGGCVTLTASEARLIPQALKDLKITDQ